MLLFLTTGCIIIGLLYLYFTRTFNYWKKRNVAGPEPTVFFGNIKDAVLRRCNITTIMEDIYKQYPEEKVVGIFRMTTPCLFLRDLDIIKHVMVKDFDLFIDRGVEFSNESLGVNLFHADGETWRILRNRFTPFFTSRKLRNMIYLMKERADHFTDYVENVCKVQPEQPIHLLIQKFTIASIAACAFGIEVDENLTKAMDKIDRLIFTINYGNEMDMMYPGILKKLNSSLFPPLVTDFFNNLVQRVIEQRGGKPSSRKDFMDMILELREKMELQGTKRLDENNINSIELTDSVIAAQAFVFYAGGYETSASTVTYLLYELAREPDVQDKLVEEIDEVLKRHNGVVSYEVLSELNYMDKVFDETLRKHPLIDPLQRMAKVNYKIPGTDITVEKGQMVLVPVMAIHRDPKYYPNPDKFDPERFSSENVRGRHSCAYLAFGTGPRSCMGLRFAKIQSKVLLLKMLSKFRVEPSKNTATEFVYDPMRLIIFPVGGIILNIVPRNL